MDNLVVQLRSEWVDVVLCKTGNLAAISWLDRNAFNEMTVITVMPFYTRHTLLIVFL